MAKRKQPPRISAPLVDIYIFMRAQRNWFTAKELAAQLDLNPRTTRKLVTLLQKNGVVDRLETFPGFSYRYCPTKSEFQTILKKASGVHV